MTYALGIPLALVAVAFAGWIGHAIRAELACRRALRPHRPELSSADLVKLQADWRLAYGRDLAQWETELREETAP